MYERYAALFALRNDGRDAAVSAIVAALGVKSALLRHEVSLELANLCLHLCFTIMNQATWNASFKLFHFYSNCF